MTHATTTKRTLRTGALLLTAAAALLGTAACNSIGDAWDVTYEVTSQDGAATTITDVSWYGAEKRGQAYDTRTVDGGATTPWTAEGLVGANDKAAVSATPEGDAVLTCRIVLNGERELVTETGNAGEAVTCETTTPKFGD